VNTIPFDVNFFNFEDPEVLEKFTKPGFEKYWKETYGFDFVMKLPENISNYAENIESNFSPLAVHCVEAESGYALFLCFHLS
jgi:hypothetical protein